MWFLTMDFGPARAGFLRARYLRDPFGWMGNSLLKTNSKVPWVSGRGLNPISLNSIIRDMRGFHCLADNLDFWYRDTVLAISGHAH